MTTEVDPQHIPFPDEHAVHHVLQGIRRLPPLVFPGEVDELRTGFAAAEGGKAFILQGGDCVERFADCTAARIADRIRILLQMSVVLAFGARMPVVRIGRIAGQYFKPRSAPWETLDGQRVLTYRGDPIHQFDPGNNGRVPDPQRLHHGYCHAAATLNYIRAMISGGFADLHHPQAWDLASMEKTPQWQEYRHIVERILEAISFMESFGGVNQEQLGNVRFYTSHEALYLPWEEALTREDSETALRYNLAAHTVWLGARSAALDGPHVAYLAGIANPVGIKAGPGMTSDHLVSLLDTVNPLRQSGRIMVVTRLGAPRVDELLPPLISAVQQANHPVVWSCDPMHGNTITTAGGRKTRPFASILQELQATFRRHSACGSRLAGVHFELTGDEVTECTGGAVSLQEEDLERNYESWCDPRLNYSQSMEMAFLLSSLLRE